MPFYTKIVNVGKELINRIHSFNHNFDGNAVMSVSITVLCILLSIYFMIIIAEKTVPVWHITPSNTPINVFIIDSKVLLRKDGKEIIVISSEKQVVLDLRGKNERNPKRISNASGSESDSYSDDKPFVFHFAEGQ